MATQLQLRRGTTSETGSFTGAVGEVTVDTTKDTLVVHDGATAGGHEMAKKDGSNMTAIDVGDNVQLKMGASDDLLIYHNGSDSYIDNVGLGSLIIQDTNGTGDIFLKPKSGQTAIGIYNDNTVELAYSGATKLGTTSSGVDVTGTATMDGLAVDGAMTGTVNNTATLAQLATDSNNALLLENTNASGSSGIRMRGGSGAAAIVYGENNSTDKFYVFPRNETSKPFTLDHIGNAEFSANVSIPSGNLGVGTSSPDAKISAQRTGSAQGVSSGYSLKGQDGTTQGGIGTDGVNDNYLQILAAQGIKFHTSNTNGSANERMRIDPSGNVSITNGDLTVASGNGVFLGGTAAANKLDDYEEGTWNPTLTFSSGSVTYGTRLGTYTKVGRQVTVQMSFGLSAVSSPSGNLSITGLPFTNASGEGFVTALNFALIRFLGTEYNTVRGFLGNGTTTITLTTNATNANAAYLNANTLTANSLIYATLTYFAA